MSAPAGQSPPGRAPGPGRHRRRRPGGGPRSGQRGGARRTADPDIAVIDSDAAASLTVDAHVLIVVEIASPSTRVTDRKMKPALYAAAGIPYYWRLELEPAPRLSLGHLERGGYTDRLVPPPGRRDHRTHRTVPLRHRPRPAGPPVEREAAAPYLPGRASHGCPAGRSRGVDGRRSAPHPAPSDQAHGRSNWPCSQ
ncbi:Uma2 family endonuclease [Streptomyces sp. NPDC051567]|uniref:Uma2 family endonuclease n=1 Tax=Streptomyces sp. NPDC051567 TaxID=3365660 RepID=UPI00379424EC